MAVVGDAVDVLLTLPEAKAHVGETTSARDAEIQRYIDAAMELIEAEVGPVVPRQVSTVVTGHSTVLLEGRVVEVESVLLNGTAVAASAYVENLAAGLLTPAYFGSLYGAVVTYTVGMSPIPEAIRQAAFYIVQHAYESQNGAVPVPYGATDETFVVARGFAMPNRAREFLAPWRRGPVIA